MPHADTAAKLLKILAHPQRLQIAVLLRHGRHDAAEISAGTGLPPAEAAKHLGRLRSEGLISVTRYHQSLVYEWVSPAARQVVEAAEQAYGPLNTPPADSKAETFATP